MMSFPKNMTFPSLVSILLLLIIFPVSARTILIVGDSLSAGYGMPVEKGWVKLLEKKLSLEDPSAQVFNVSTSGDTTSQGLAKLDRGLAHHPNVVVIELGANDGLRGLPLKNMHNNLSMMVKKSRDVGACVLLLATPLPPNYGTAFLEEYKAVFKRVAEEHQVVLVPMFLEGVAGHHKYMQEDRLHPNELAQEIILANIWPHLKELKC